MADVPKIWIKSFFFKEQLSTKSRDQPTLNNFFFCSNDPFQRNSFWKKSWIMFFCHLWNFFSAANFFGAKKTDSGWKLSFAKKVLKFVSFRTQTWSSLAEPLIRVKNFLDLERNSTQVEGNALRSGLIGPGPKSDQDNTWANGSSLSNKDQNQFCSKIVDVSYLFKELNGGKTNT